jgi:dephospho-CoA kinase
MQNKKIFVGVTGGIGSGKSLVCKYMNELGCIVFTADELAKKLYESNDRLRKKLKDEFGEDILDSTGKISLDLLKHRVFGNKSNVKRVNDIVHPFVINKKMKMYNRVKKGIVITEAALIFESGFDKNLDYVVEVFSNQKTRIERVQKRNKFSVRKIKEIISMQIPESEKLRRADIVIYNNSTKSELKKRTVFLFNLLRNILESR